MTIRLACVALLTMVACDASSETAPDAGVDASEPDAVVRAPAPDLRFQWVGAADHFVQRLITNIDPGVTQSEHGDYVWGPLWLATRQSGSAGWNIADFSPAGPIEAMDSLAGGGLLTGLDAKLDQLAAQGYVITSLDVTADAFGLVASAPVSRTPRYEAHATTTDRAGLAAFVAAQAQLGRVVTAVSGDGAAIHALAYARGGDAATYDATVADATPETLVTVATDLATAGYTITGFGRNGDGPLVLVGTRPTGVRTPRTITAQAVINPVLADHGALVAWLLDSRGAGPPWPSLVVLER